MILGEEKMSITVPVEKVARQLKIADFVSKRYERYGVKCTGLSVSEIEADPTTDYEVVVRVQFSIKQEGELGEWGKGSKRSENWHKKRSLLISILKNLGYVAYPTSTGFSLC